MSGEQSFQGTVNTTTLNHAYNVVLQDYVQGLSSALSHAFDQLFLRTATEALTKAKQQREQRMGPAPQRSQPSGPVLLTPAHVLIDMMMTRMPREKQVVPMAVGGVSASNELPASCDSYEQFQELFGCGCAPRMQAMRAEIERNYMDQCALLAEYAHHAPPQNALRVGDILRSVMQERVAFLVPLFRQVFKLAQCTRATARLSTEPKELDIAYPKDALLFSTTFRRVGDGVRDGWMQSVLMPAQSGEQHELRMHTMQQVAKGVLFDLLNLNYIYDDYLANHAGAQHDSDDGYSSDESEVSSGASTPDADEPLQLPEEALSPLTPPSPPSPTPPARAAEAQQDEPKYRVASVKQATMPPSRKAVMGHTKRHSPSSTKDSEGESESDDDLALTSESEGEDDWE